MAIPLLKHNDPGRFNAIGLSTYGVAEQQLFRGLTMRFDPKRQLLPELENRRFFGFGFNVYRERKAPPLAGEIPDIDKIVMAPRMGPVPAVDWR